MFVFIPPQISTVVVCWAPGRATVQDYRKTCWSAAPRQRSAANHEWWWKAPCHWSAGTTRDTSGSSPTVTPQQNKVNGALLHPKTKTLKSDLNYEYFKNFSTDRRRYTQYALLHKMNVFIVVGNHKCAVMSVKKFALVTIRWNWHIVKHSCREKSMRASNPW